MPVHPRDVSMSPLQRGDRIEPQDAKSCRKQCIQVCMPQLLPYLYTQFHIAHRTGAPVARPLFWAAPGDAAAREAHAQWLLGDAVLVSPVVHEGADTVRLHSIGWVGIKRESCTFLM